MSSSALYTNNAATTLASAITISATTLSVVTSAGALFPAITGLQYFYCTLQAAIGLPIEIVKVTARSGDVFTILRAQDNTSASAFSANDKVELRIVSAELNLISSGIVQGGGQDQCFVENSRTITTSYTLTTGRSSSSVGPVTLNSGVVVTLPSGAKWVVL